MNYKAEFFDRFFDFKFFSVIGEAEIVSDYLTLDKTSIVIPSIAEISRGWYCHITRGADVVYQGIVSGVDTGKSATTVRLSPLLSLFEFQFYYNRKTYNSSKTDLEGWFRSAILATFAGSDNTQNIPGLSVTAATHTDGVDLNLKDNIHDFWDLARKALESSKIAIDCEFNPSAKTITAAIRNHSSESEITIESDLQNISDRKFTLRDNYGNVNKVVVYNAEDSTQSQTFYASDYAAPVVQRIAEVTVEDGQSFSTAAREKSAELMRKTDADNLIELTIRVGDRIIPALHVGQPVRILKNGVAYHTVYSGKAEKKTEKGGSVTLIFGLIRTDLTKILKLKGAI
ncbi:MAG: hypothetical protein IIZ08_09600 [Clostridia bacterium]|nr:hypothetical protein [Clostridia bacterium]